LGSSVGPGGGGGGHIGAGGQGGNSEDGARVVGGQGGTALTYTALNQLNFGGGGGAGHMINGGTSAGGLGGGCVFIRAGSLAGTGSYSANPNPGNSPTTGDAGGGGGAGGAVYLRVVGDAAFNAINVPGGAGGSSTLGSSVGPGGGGGGGRVIFQKGGGTGAPTAASVNGGAAGINQTASNYGATAGAVGLITTLSGGFAQVAEPVLVTPAAGATGVATTPAFTGTATAGLLVHIEVDGVEIGSTTADGSGNFSFTPVTPLANGARSVEVYADNYAAQGTYSFNSAARSFTVGSPASTNANLSALSLSSGTLSPTFASATTAYTATVPRATASVTVTPTKADANATLQVRVNGGAYAAATSGSPGAALALNLGRNTIDVLVTAQDGTTTKTYTTTVTRWTYVEGWRNQYFATIANSGNAADTATPQSDGLPNLVKFAFGMNPTVNGVSPVVAVKNGSVLEFTYPRSIEAMAECTFVVEWSDTLVSGSWSTTGVTENILSATATVQQVKVSIPAGAGVERRFVRLRVTRP
ncbi:MAG: cadherin-like beta sandwich domain-containing protein, partial [Prosthecobacter sp.]